MTSLFCVFSTSFVYRFKEFSLWLENTGKNEGKIQERKCTKEANIIKLKNQLQQLRKIDKPKIHVAYVKTQLKKPLKIGVNRMYTYSVLKTFFSFNSLEK